MTESLLAPHARGKIFTDPIFTVAAKARAAREQFGAAHIVDGSIGVLLDNNGRLAVMASVQEASERLTLEEVADYAPIAGVREFRDDVCRYLFGDLLAAMPTVSLATAGATGAIRLAIWNFLQKGDAVLTHDFYWNPYQSISRDCERRLEVFPTYLENGGFNVAGALASTAKLLTDQGRALLIVNTPCLNPIGLGLKSDEVIALRDGLATLARANPEAPLVLLIDGAYWEYGDAEDNRSLIAAFREMPENMVFCFAFSLAKSMTRYGLRAGALVMATARQTLLDELTGTMAASIRGTWSNSNHMGQSLFTKIYRDPVLFAKLRQEQHASAELCNQRGRTFVNEARAAGLPVAPYQSGFFATIPTADSQEICDRLCEANIFLVPLRKGVRIALCALPDQQVPGLAARIAPYFKP